MWGSSGNGDGQFIRPRGIAIGPPIESDPTEGIYQNVYVADNNHRIQKFSKILPSGDITPPSITVTHSPINPISTQPVTYTASVSDQSGSLEIKIYTTNGIQKCDLVKTCSYIEGPYPIYSTQYYYATAIDNSLNQNQGRDPATGTKSFTVDR